MIEFSHLTEFVSTDLSFKVYRAIGSVGFLIYSKILRADDTSPGSSLVSAQMFTIHNAAGPPSATRPRVTNFKLMNQ